MNASKRQFIRAIHRGNVRSAKELLSAGLAPTADLVEDAVFFNKPNILQALIEAGANIQAPSVRGLKETPLFLAARFGHLEALKILLRAGADPKAQMGRGNTPLHQAHNDRIVHALLEAGANIHAKNSVGRTPLHKARNERVVRALIEAGANLHAKNSYGEKPAHVASHSGSLGGLQALLAAGGPYMNGKRRRPLHHAVTGDKVRAILQAGANPRALSRNGETPLHYAAITNASKNTIKALLEGGVNKNARHISGRTALMYAATYGSPNAVHALLEGGADSSIRNTFGKTARNYARNFNRENAKNNHPKNVERIFNLYTHRGTLPRIRDILTHGYAKRRRIFDTYSAT